jgi:SAM-dependent methyltransferase
MILTQPRILPISYTGSEIAVTQIPLRRDDPSSPWCYASSSSLLLPPGTNFLATQVWPSSRIASTIIERHMDPSWIVCELGCGPGLPSLTAARSGAKRVIATDVDEVALEMVRAAALEQDFIEEKFKCNDDDNDDEHDNEQRFITMKFDLTSRDDLLPKADLYILSDVFESSFVAEGAAWHVKNILTNNRKGDEFARVWVFAQSDRPQRDFFLNKMKEWNVDDNERLLAEWTLDHNPPHDAELWLFDLDETSVSYN